MRDDVLVPSASPQPQQAQPSERTPQSFNQENQGDVSTPKQSRVPSREIKEEKQQEQEQEEEQQASQRALLNLNLNLESNLKSQEQFILLRIQPASIPFDLPTMVPFHLPLSPRTPTSPLQLRLPLIDQYLHSKLDRT